MLLSLLVLAIGWSALWWFARREAERSFADWIDAERQQGRVWTCPDRTIGGYPFAIDLRCSNPSFAEADNPAFGGQLAGLRAVARLYFPTSVAVDLFGPLVIKDVAVDSGLTVNWAAARVTLRGDLPGRLDRGHIDADHVVIAAAPPHAPTAIDAATLAFQPLGADNAAELKLEASGVRDPEADTVFGSADPAATEVKATIRQMPQRGASLATLLEQWRQADGSLTLDTVAFTKGSFRAQGSGRLTVDEQHRPAGRIQTRFTGLEPLAARFGIPVAAVKLGGLLSNLLGGKSAPPDKPADSTLDLPIVIRDGRLYLGPAKTGFVIPPLY